jgi:hypothetical protein
MPGLTLLEERTVTPGSRSGTRITVDLDPPLHRKAKLQSFNDGITTSDAVRVLLELWTEDNDLQQRVLEVLHQRSNPRSP